MVTSRFVRNGATLVFVLACCACASTTPTQTAASEEPKPDKMFRTGSRIPVKDPDAAYSKTVDTQSMQDKMMQGGAGPSPKGQ